MANADDLSQYDPFYGMGYEAPNFEHKVIHSSRIIHTVIPNYDNFIAMQIVPKINTDQLRLVICIKINF